MRKVIAEIAMSLDGFIEGVNGELDWLISDGDANHVSDFLSRFDVIFYGRKAYEKLGVHLVGSGELYETMSGMRKYVFSRSLRHVPGNGMVINSSIRENVLRIKEEEGKDIWLCGGAGIIRTFASLDLIDEYILAIQPVVLGKGKPLFNKFNRRTDLQLLGSQYLDSGVVVLNYECTHFTSHV